ncbi:ASCH domain-containing protein [Paenibacillus sp. GXUN7292]|uniref:ASCH domain-containing protein n=1 Tax=Paenibacillus sp. GXUN7292 TaxID=3422499 RepID=UPI003D7E9341
MKAITIHQPWATLIAIGAKRFETRGWPARYRGTIAIHAAKRIDREACECEPIKSALAEHGYTADNLPTGAVVATANLHDCKSEVERAGNRARLAGAHGDVWIDTNSNEYYFGWFGIGRYAWELTNVQQLLEPIPAKGQQGLWNWEVVL